MIRSQEAPIEHDPTMREETNPFKIPTDEEVFFLREEERKLKRLERERLRYRKVTRENQLCGAFTVPQHAARPPGDGSTTLPPLTGTVEPMNTTNNNNTTAAVRNIAPHLEGSPAALRSGDTVSMSEFIKEKRRMGLKRMSLATKRAEIKKLEEEAAQAEKRITDLERQLRDTDDRFESFMKENNLEQVDAKRRVDAETKQKQLNAQKVKKLNSQILQVEMEKKRIEEQLSVCLRFKKDLDAMTPDSHFRQILQRIWTEDAQRDYERAQSVKQRNATETISPPHNLASSPLTIQVTHQRANSEKAIGVSTVVHNAGEDQLAGGGPTVTTAATSQPSSPLAVQPGTNSREPDATRSSKVSSPVLAGKSARGAGEPTSRKSNDPDSLESQSRAQPRPDPVGSPFTSTRCSTFECGTATEFASVVESITLKVQEMSKDALIATLDTYPVDRVPMYFQDHQLILNMFVDIEEQNLVLITMCQKMEEDLETLKQKFTADRIRMDHEAANLRQQIEVMKQRIAVEESKKKALLDRVEKAKQVTMSVVRMEDELREVDQDVLIKMIQQRVTSIFHAANLHADEASDNTVMMLTMIETRLEELRNVIANEKEFPRSMVTEHMKKRDKERRQKARQKTIDAANRQREVRNQQAVLRSQAIVQKRAGKPVMWRSKPNDIHSTDTGALDTNKQQNEEDEYFLP